MKNKKEILIGTLGTSPAIITELLYYYSHPYYKNVRNFDKIIFFTTKKGKEVAHRELFENNIINKLHNDLNLKQKAFNLTKEDIIFIKDNKGSEIEDTRINSDSFELMNEIFETMKKYSNDSNWRITATIAGGRKNMSTMMSTSFQMLARKEDELIHIIAPDDLMYNNEISWFYPSKASDPKQKLDVSIVPTLKIGSLLPFKTEDSFIELFDKMQTYLFDQSPLSQLNIKKNTFSANEESFTLQPMHASYLRYFILKRLNSDCKSTCNGCKDCLADFLTLAAASQCEILKEHKIISGEENQHYKLKREKNLQYDINDIDQPEAGYGRDALKSRNRQDIARLRKEFSKLNISQKFKKTLEIKTCKVDGDWHIGVNLMSMNKKTVSFDD